MLTLEESALTVWIASSGPQDDPDGMVTLVTPMARAHVLNAGVFGIADGVKIY